MDLFSLVSFKFMLNYNFNQYQFSKRNKILKDYGFKSYKDFLNSSEWKFAKEKLKKRNKGCQVCKREDNIHVHHVRYTEENLVGSINGLVLLCGNCHNEVHRLTNKLNWSFKKSMKSITKRFNLYKDIHFFPQKSSVIHRYGDIR